jgi:hypothetical protein
MDAEIKVYRKWFTARTTIGELYINGVFFCYTLEDTIRPFGVKVSGETGIPEGTYKCEISLSTRFKREMPMVFTEDNGYELINNGISFKGIRIHGGNTHKNTEGCILVAYNKVDENTIQGTAEYDLTEKLKEFNKVTVKTYNQQEK